MIINMYYVKSKTIINFAYSEGSGGGGGGEKIVIPDGWTLMSWEDYNMSGI